MPNGERITRLLRRAYEHGDMTRWREFFRLASREAMGPNCESENIPSDPDQLKPLNPLGEMARTYLPHLLGDRLLPRVMQRGAGSSGMASLMQARLRRWADDTKYAAHDDMGVMDSILQAGIWYVGRRTGFDAVAIQNTTADVGQPFVVRIQPDQFVYDSGAPSWDCCSWMADLVEVDRDSLLEANIGDPDVINKINPVWAGNNRNESARRAGMNEQDLYLDTRIALWRVCFLLGGRRYWCVVPSWDDGPQDFIVEPTEQGSMEPEPEGSRYVVCALGTAPHILTSDSPAKALMHMHIARQKLGTKAVRQIDEARRQVVADPAAKRLVEQMLDPKREDKVAWGDPSTVKVEEIGGLADQTIKGDEWLRASAQQIGPNVQLAGGRDDPSRTATGSSILAGNAGVVLAKWGNKVTEARETILRRVAAMLLASEEAMELSVQTPAGPLPVVWNPQQMDVSYDQFAYSITPTTAGQVMDPAMRVQRLVEILNTIPVVVQNMMMLGGDPAVVVRKISDAAQMPELDEILPTIDSEQLKMALAASAMQAGAAQMAGPAAGQRPRSLPATRQASMQSAYSASVPNGA